MPYTPQDVIDRSNQVLSSGNTVDIRRLLTTQPILPPAGGISLAALGQTDRKFSDVVKLDFSKLKITSAAHSVMFIKLRPNAKNEIGAMTFALKSPSDLPTVVSRQGWAPVWWLPWQNSHLVKMKILGAAAVPSIAIGGGVAPVANPGIFFTAAINGCSVFAVGDATAPSLYHGGVDGDFTARTPTEKTEDAWRRLLGRVHSTKNIGGVGKTDYIKELPSGANESGRLQTTNAAIALESTLQQNGSLTNVSVRPFGMVFGLRDAGGNWTMTLVRNALVTYHRLVTTSKARFLRKPKTRTVTQGEKLPTRFYDNAGDLTQEQPATAETAIQTCVTLGYHDFFPGATHVTLYDTRTIQIY